MEGNDQAKLLGELGSIGLTDIFETLGKRQRYGWLFLRNEEEVILYFQGDLVGLVTPPEKKLAYVPAKLHHAGYLSPESYDAVIESNDPFQELEQRIDIQVMESLLNTIYYDEICSLFSWKSGYFEFVDQQNANMEQREPIGELFEAENIVMEAARRMDESREIHKTLPDEDELLVHAEEAHHAYSADDPVGNIWLLAHYRSVQEAIDFSYLSEFDAAKVLAALFQEGSIRTLDSSELKEQGKILLQQDDYIQAAKFFHLVLKKNPFDFAACEDLIHCYEKDGNEAALVQLFKNMSSVFLASRSSEHIMQGAYYLKKFSDATHEQPEGIEARLKLLQMTVNNQIDPKMIDYNPIMDGKWLFQSLRRKKDDEIAKSVLHQLLQLTPHNKSLQSELINVYLDLNEIDNAVAQYEAMAKIYEKENDLAELESTYYKIVKLMPGRKDIVQKLEKIRSRRRRNKYKFGQIAAAIVIIALGVVGWMKFQESVIRQQQEQEIFEKSFLELVNEGQYTQADSLLKEKQDLFSLGEIEEYQRTIEQYKREQTEEAERNIIRARTKEEERYLLEAKKIYDDIAKLQIQGSLREEAAQESARIGKILKKYEGMIDNARLMENEGDYKGATAIYKDIWNERLYDHLQERNEILFPIKFTISPKNASVYIDGEKKDLAATKGVVRCSPNFQKIVIQHKGYSPHHFYNAFRRIAPRIETDTSGIYLYPLFTGEVSIQLKKDKLWIFTLPGLIDSHLCFAENEIYIASRDDNIYALKNIFEKAEKKWSVSKTDALASFSTTPCYHQGFIYIGGNNGYFYAVDTSSGEIAARYKVGNVFIGTSPAVCDDLKTVVFGTSSGKFYAFPLINRSTDNWSPLWSAQVASNKLNGAIIVSGTYAFALGDLRSDKNIYGISLRRQKPVWKTAISPLKSPPLIYNKKIYIGGEQAFYKYEPFRERVWQVEVKGSITQEPLINDKGIFFGTTDKKVYAVAANSDNKAPEILWTFETQEEVKCTPVMNDSGILYIADKKQLYALDTNNKGNVYWTYTPDEEIVSNPILSNQVIFIATKNSVYGFIDN